MPAAPSYTRRVLIAVGVVVAAFVVLAFLWGARPILLLGFGAVLLAVGLRGLGRGLRRLVPRLGPKAAAGLAAAGLVGLLVAFGVFVAPRVGEEATALAEALPAGIDRVRAWLDARPWGQSVVAQFREDGALPDVTQSFGQLSGILSGTVGVVTNALVVVFAGLFLALDPDRYRDGFARLFPPPRRPRAREVLDRTGDRLVGWLLGQVISMAVVGTLTGLGLWLVGVPLALVLGVIAFVCAFVPFIGPLVATVPGVLLAFSQGPETALYALLVYVGVQQVESYGVTPFVQEKTVSIPPALTMLGALLGGVLFGLPGTVLAVPLLVVVLTLIDEVYVKDILGDRGDVEGRADDDAGAAVSESS